ncbi:ABC transporter permease [Dysgonomonas macrotermitis]|uniref:Putative ABC transport system permease protein n=1 Tax=Dysgonomonas macrotermitis TaxID=1346286 RepID=A0A1M4Z8Q2_9BACT|nr:ABC transporter permease [Dysgonomonas macrotermitis]SHF14142.1 putative ABC transport system permease protein [Dysgonomonas macrotermitis]
MKQFIRNFRKQKTVGILNICSLSLGIMVSIIIGLWAFNELSFDDFHKNKDRMYRVVQNFDVGNEPVRAATAFKPLGELAEAEIPEIEQMCRVVVNRGEDGVAIQDIVHFDFVSIVTDHNFFSFFTFPLKEGEIKTAFSKPDNVIITESTANRYFPDENPIGKTVRYHGSDFTISAIMYDFPKNSHIQADMVFPLFKHFKDWGWDSSFSYDTYFVLSQNADIPAIEKKLSEINLANMSELLQNAKITTELEPLAEIHFSKTSAGFDSALRGNKDLLQTFISIAAIILIISCINFTNLSISTSFIRAKSIGIKKSQGAGKKQLVVEFYRETATYAIIAVLLGISLAMIAFPIFNTYTGSDIGIDFSSPRFYAFVGVLILLVTLIAGTFPAFQMTRFGIVETIKGKFKGKNMSVFQKILIIIQFTSSISLLIIVMFFAKQINQILSQDLGFDNKNIVYVNGWGAFGPNFKNLREELMKEPTIVDVAMKQYHLPLAMGNGLGATNEKTGNNFLLDMSQVSPNYFNFFGMEFIEGENPLILESESAATYCVLNETAVRLLGIEDPVNKPFNIISIGGSLAERAGQPFIIKGVIRDSYVKSLYQEPDPQMYLGLGRDDNNPIFFKIAGDPQRAISVIEKKWKELLPNVTFEYRFLDETYDAQYKTEINSKNILLFALVITILITVAGLYAMIFYSTQRRIKEIGIRKINGATIPNLLLLLNKDIVVWVILSFVIACPLSYLFIDNWLKSFVIKTPLSIWIFAIAGFMSIAIALLTVCYQTWKSANMNPVDAIKIE